jgi:aconitate hydratase
MDYPSIPQPERYFTEADMFVHPTGRAAVYRGPGMGPPPSNTPMPADLAAEAAIKLGDKVTTDHIIPAGSAGRFRSNIAKSSDFVFRNVDPHFPARCVALKSRGLSAVIVAGLSYGQGSSREHAAICPMVLGVRAVMAKSIERIHLANLINLGVMPLIFKQPKDYDRIQAGDELEIADTAGQFRRREVVVTNRTQQTNFTLEHALSPRQVEIVLCGGLLNHVGGIRSGRHNT